MTHLRKRPDRGRSGRFLASSPLPRSARVAAAPIALLMCQIASGASQTDGCSLRLLGRPPSGSCASRSGCGALCAHRPRTSPIGSSSRQSVESWPESSSSVLHWRNSFVGFAAAQRNPVAIRGRDERVCVATPTCHQCDTKLSPVATRTVSSHCGWFGSCGAVNVQVADERAHGNRQARRCV